MAVDENREFGLLMARQVGVADLHSRPASPAPSSAQSHDRHAIIALQHRVHTQVSLGLSCPPLPPRAPVSVQPAGAEGVRPRSTTSSGRGRVLASDWQHRGARQARQAASQLRTGDGKLTLFSALSCLRPVGSKPMPLIACAENTRFVFSSHPGSFS